MDEDPFITHKPAGTVLNITTLAVGQSYQGRGYGEQLLQAAIEIACRERCTQIILETARAERFLLAPWAYENWRTATAGDFAAYYGLDAGYGVDIQHLEIRDWRLEIRNHNLQSLISNLPFIFIILTSVSHQPFMIPRNNEHDIITPISAEL